MRETVDCILEMADDFFGNETHEKLCFIVVN